MYCRMVRGVYLRANGEMACYCGAGENVQLGWFPVDGDNRNFVPKYYMNEAHGKVRRLMAAGELPHLATCLKCYYLEPHLPTQLEKLDHEIEWIHIEPTSLCNLQCKFCIPPDERKTYRSKPHIIPFDAYKAMIKNIVSHNMHVPWMYFSGRGEPGLHPHLWKMVKFTKEHLDTNFLVNTNGNIPFNELIIDSRLDKIKIAVDGHNQETYSTYRRGGSFDRVKDLTFRISQYKQKKEVCYPKVIWQYILFEHNDSMDNIREFQQIALDMGVDEILFKTTFSTGYSNFNLSDLEYIHPNVKIEDMRTYLQVEPEWLESQMRQIKSYLLNGDACSASNHAIEGVKRVFMTLMLGIERKQLYNTYGTDPSLEGFFSFCRNHEKKMLPVLDIVISIAESAADSCYGDDRPRTSRYFSNLTQALKKEMSTL